MSDSATPNADAARAAAHVAQIVEEVIRRRAAGEVLPDEAVLAAHPDLLPELADRLRDLAIVDAAYLRVQAGPTNSAGEPAAAQADTFPTPTPLDTAESTAAARPVALPQGDSIPGYEILREIHRGGQGVVYQAVQKSTNRKVAIKVMREGPFAGTVDKARFEREVQILGQLQHPNIVGVHDSGSAAGSFYFVMDYISGQPLDVYLAGAAEKAPGAKGSKDAGRVGLSIDSTLKLFAKICEAVNAAHLRGVIHRDLKPGNIRIDAQGEPHVLDFGLAKVAGGQTGPGELAAMTMTGQFVGSLPWSAPEQAEGAPSKIDTRTDVYSLGVVLYQMLTGKFPYEVVGNMRDVLDRIMKAEPAKPSTIRRQINDEVETIVLKCLSKERERRYQTAGELARDIQRYLTGEPVEAKRDSAFYVLRKHLKRYRLPLTIATGFVTLLAASTIVTWVQYRQAQSRLWESYLSAARAHRFTAVPGRKKESLDALRRAAAIRPTRAIRNEAIAALALFDVQPIHERPSRWGSAAVQFSPQLTHEVFWRWGGGLFAVRRLGEDLPILEQSDSNAQFLVPCFSPDGRLLAKSTTTECQIWNLEARQVVSRFPARVSSPSKCDFRPDGRKLAVPDRNGVVHIHDIETHETRTMTIAKTHIWQLQFHPRDDLLVASAYDNSDALLVDVSTGEVTERMPHPDDIAAVRWSPDGSRLAVGCRDGRVYLRDYATRAVVHALTGHTHLPTDILFSPRGDRLWSMAWDGTTRIWDPCAGTLILTWDGFVRQVGSDGRGFAYERRQNGLSTGLGQVDDSEVYGNIRPVTENARASTGYSVAASRDGRLAASAGAHFIRFWDMDRSEMLVSTPMNEVHTVIFLSSGFKLVTSSEETGVLQWPILRHADCLCIGPPERISPESWHCKDASLAADERTLAVGVNRKDVGILMLGGAPVEPRIIGEHPNLRYVAISPDGRWVASAGDQDQSDGETRVWDTRTSTLAQSFLSSRGNALVFSSDSRWLVASGSDHRIWSVGDWKVHATFSHTGGPTPSAAFSPNSEIAALITGRHQIDLVDLADMSCFAQLECPDPIGSEAITFGADGSRLMVPDMTGRTLHTWDLRALRRHLADMGLDWDLPPYTPALPQSAGAITVEVDLGELRVPDSE